MRLEEHLNIYWTNMRCAINAKMYLKTHWRFVALCNSSKDFDALFYIWKLLNAFSLVRNATVERVTINMASWMKVLVTQNASRMNSRNVEVQMPTAFILVSRLFFSIWHMPNTINSSLLSVALTEAYNGTCATKRKILLLWRSKLYVQETCRLFSAE